MDKKLLFIHFFPFLIFLFFILPAMAQGGSLRLHVAHAGKAVPGASLSVPRLHIASVTDSGGNYSFTAVPFGRYDLQVSHSGYQPAKTEINVASEEPVVVEIDLQENTASLDEIVVTGTLKEVSRSASPVPVEVYTPKYFQKNPTPCLFEAVGLINGVRPQLNCNVCNTGDIHINGMEGPYTLVLIDGMPIVSALSTVYGLMGIPNSMVERLEVVKGPAASLYGSEAMGGIINVITKNPAKAPLFSIDVFGTTWQEYNADAAVKLTAGKVQSLAGLSYFTYQNRLDKNGDGFTDVTLQKRLSFFNKWSLQRKEERAASLGIRYVHENRFGGQMAWTGQWRGSDSIYGESIYTGRFELFGLYQLPVKEKVVLQYSWNWHHQDSYYGSTPYNATQRVGFAQLYWDKRLSPTHDFLLGASYRTTFYDDNTPATASADSVNPENRPVHTPLPGVFVQDEWKLNDQHTLLLGYRYDFDKTHGSIHSPRLAYKWSPDKDNAVRASFGSGFRVVNLFTEDHAALTGAREVVIKEALKPERSFNATLNYALKIPAQNFFVGLDLTGFYSYFTNKITGDYDTDPNKIIYDNLAGHAVSRGISLNGECSFHFPLKILAGLSYLDVFAVEKDGAGNFTKTTQVFAPKWSGNYLVSYTFPKQITVDFTGNFNGPMRLPLQPNDYRPGLSPWFTLATLQITKKFGRGLEVYSGVKNLLNFVPPYSLMRPFDPFDKTVNDPVTNPYGYTFDTEYNYAPIQGRRGFLGVRYNLSK